MGGFSTESLEKYIEACKVNIQTFEDAIEKERVTIKETRAMIEVIENKVAMPVLEIKAEK